jgi:hypothetical protein
MTIIKMCPSCQRKQLKYNFLKGVWCCPKVILVKGIMKKYGCGFENNKPEQRKLNGQTH